MALSISRLYINPTISLFGFLNIAIENACQIDLELGTPYVNSL